MKDLFMNTLLAPNVGRKGMENLIDCLKDKTDFFTAPASARYHGACEGGLLEHSIAVMRQTGKLASLYLPDAKTKLDSLLIISLLHDVCKANFYSISYRNAKNEYGQWEKVPYYTIADQAPLGHGEKSAYIVSKYIDLSEEEYAAIRWHMGAWGTEDYGGRQALNAAMEKYPLVLLLQMADLAATYYYKK